MIPLYINVIEVAFIFSNTLQDDELSFSKLLKAFAKGQAA